MSNAQISISKNPWIKTGNRDEMLHCVIDRHVIEYTSI